MRLCKDFLWAHGSTMRKPEDIVFFSFFLFLSSPSSKCLKALGRSCLGIGFGYVLFVSFSLEGIHWWARRRCFCFFFIKIMYEYDYKLIRFHGKCSSFDSLVV